MFLSTDSSPWSAVRGSPELRAYSSMPRGSVPWPQRNGSGGSGVGAVIGIGRSAQATAKPENPEDRPAQRKPAIEVNTVHLVDTCGHVIDMQTVSESTGTAIADPSTLKTLGNVDHPGGDEPEDFRRKQVATALTRVQEDLKHIPPGKKQRLSHSYCFLAFTVGRAIYCICRAVSKCLKQGPLKC